MERYDNMRSLGDNLNTLFELCGLEPKPVKVKASPKVIRMVEKRLDSSLCGYLDTLDRRTAQAVKALRERQQTERKNREQCRQKQQELEEQLESEQNRYRELVEKLESEQSRRSKLEEELESENRLHGEQVIKLVQDKENEQKRADGLNTENLELIRNIIAMRDNLLMRRDWLRDNSPEDKNAFKLVENQLRESGKLLTKAGVEILEDKGSFDGSRHTVVETKPAQDPSQVDQIAEVFRPGYVYKGESLRGQEVILFV